MTFKNYKSLKIGDWNFKKLIRASDGLVLFEKYSKPYDAEIAYLETTGQQYIDTGIFPSLDMEFNTKIYTPKVGDDYFCSLRKDGGNTRYYLLNYNSSAGYVCTKSSWPCAAKKPNYFSTNTHIIKSKITQDKVSIEVDGSYVEYADKGGLFSPDKTLPLFGAKVNSTTINARSNVGTRCYYAKFISNGQVVGDFIPVRVGNVGYMYDKVSGKLFGNLGAGNFILGPDIVENPYVTDGLVAMWDAEWNDGVCSHVSTSTKWIDIVSGYNLELATGTPTWEAKANVINGKWGIVSPELQALFKAANKNNLSYELCFSALPYNIKGTVLGFTDTLIGTITHNSAIGDWCWSIQWIHPTKFESTRKGTLSVVRNGQTSYTDVYADGEVFGGKSGTTGDPTGVTFGIGYGYGQWNNAPTNIKIHCIRLYNRMLTESEIQKNKDIDTNRFLI